MKEIVNQSNIPGFINNSDLNKKIATPAKKKKKRIKSIAR